MVVSAKMVVSAPKTSRNTVYEELRPLLFSIAYRMVGSASEAEDLVQEAFLRFHRETSEGADIDSPKAWLSTVTTRLAINHLQWHACVERTMSAPGSQSPC